MRTAAEHLFELIRIPSPSSVSNRAVVEYAADVFRQAGWTTEEMTWVDRSRIEKVNLIAAPPGQDVQDASVNLAFMCHTDTVPYAADWTEALDPFLADGMLHGCGACDVKGFLACLLNAIEDSVAAPLQPGLRVILTADEEVGCLGAHRLLASGLLRPRRLVIGEPTSLHPARAGKGYCLAGVTVFGAEAHSAHPSQGRSAIYDAARFIGEIEALGKRIAEQRNEFFDPACTTINVGTIQGGTAKNIVPAQCSFLVEWRPIPADATTAVSDEIMRIGRAIQESGAGQESGARFRFEMKILRQQPGFETKQASGLVWAMEHMTGKRSVSIPFGSEANVFAQVTEEIIVFGPGDMRTAHSPRECVPLSELRDAVLCIKALMQGA